MSTESQDNDPGSSSSYYKAWNEREKQGWSETYSHDFDDEPVGEMRIHQNGKCVGVTLNGIMALSAPDADIDAGVLSGPGATVEIGFFHATEGEGFTVVSLDDPAAEWLAAKLSELVAMRKEARSPQKTVTPSSWSN
jgi:hypothetical protein